MKPIVLSYGGGRQTVAICVAISKGLLPKPDHIVMADTGRERTSTWEYLHNVMAPYLAKIGLAVEVVPHSLSLNDLYGGKDKDTLLMPVYTTNGKLRTFCSGEWKRDVINRYLSKLGIKKRIQWLGYSTDEMRRIHFSRTQSVEHQFPLIEPLRWSTQKCVAVVEEEGLPTPPKSACWCCPHWSEQEWLEMKNNYPDDFKKACELDEQIREQDQFNDVFLFKKRIPLKLAELESGDQETLFNACDSGYCFN